ncbi:hypothetical protein DGWBC_1555 [Dehalogenimonas sp. WBC-2]|nr:hypothetical protein DGWBC_1555 [Dehalogenimonas sp. WBC-2]
MALKQIKTDSKSVADVGESVPSNFKFGIIVAVALVWAEFIHSVLDTVFSSINLPGGPIISGLIIAILVTLLALGLLLGYRKFVGLLKRIRLR